MAKVKAAAKHPDVIRAGASSKFPIMLAAAGIIIVVAALAVFFIFFQAPGIRECWADSNCINDAADKCVRARGTFTQDAGYGMALTMFAEVKGGTVESCTYFINVTNVTVPSGYEQVVAMFTGKSMNCTTPASHDFINNTSDLVQHCTGPLRDLMVSLTGSCANDSDCNYWQECSSGACVLRNGMCTDESDCYDYETCDSSHNCALLPGSCYDASDCSSGGCVNHACLSEADLSVTKCVFNGPVLTVRNDGAVLNGPLYWTVYDSQGNTACLRAFGLDAGESIGSGETQSWSSLVACELHGGGLQYDFVLAGVANATKSRFSCQAY